MNLIVTFSGREDGNCKSIAKFISKDDDKIIDFKNIDCHSCSNCNYECFSSKCIYNNDGIYNLYESMLSYNKVYLVVPMYCGNPSSLYFVFNERSQDFFMHNESKYDEILSKLYIIGVYGSKEESPYFIPCLEGWFVDSKYRNHVLGLERHKYNQKMADNIINACEVKNLLTAFIN